MQGTRANRRRIIIEVLSIALLGLLIFLDQITKHHFSTTVKYGTKQPIIENFFYFTYTLNKGAAWSFLADVSWGQTFFKILTGISLVFFIWFYIFNAKKNYKWLRIAIILVIGGTIGNFIDRLRIDAVVDFIGFTFGTYNFPIFNLADSFLVVGVIMVFIHYLFFDKNAIFIKNNDEKDISDIEQNGKD